MRLRDDKEICIATLSIMLLIILVVINCIDTPRSRSEIEGSHAKIRVKLMDDTWLAERGHTQCQNIFNFLYSLAACVCNSACLNIILRRCHNPNRFDLY